MNEEYNCPDEHWLSANDWDNRHIIAAKAAHEEDMSDLEDMKLDQLLDSISSSYNYAKKMSALVESSLQPAALDSLVKISAQYSIEYDERYLKSVKHAMKYFAPFCNLKNPSLEIEKNRISPAYQVLFRMFVESAPSNIGRSFENIKFNSLISLETAVMISVALRKTEVVLNPTIPKSEQIF
jgi:hypothetical protein